MGAEGAARACSPEYYIFPSVDVDVIVDTLRHIKKTAVPVATAS